MKYRSRLIFFFSYVYPVVPVLSLKKKNLYLNLICSLVKKKKIYWPYICCCLVVKLYSTLYDPMDCSLPGSSVHGISQAKILEWVAISSSRGSFQPRDRTHISFNSSCMAGGFFTVELPGKLTGSISRFYSVPFFSSCFLLVILLCFESCRLYRNFWNLIR